MTRNPLHKAWLLMACLAMANKASLSDGRIADRATDPDDHTYDAAQPSVSPKVPAPRKLYGVDVSFPVKHSLTKELSLAHGHTEAVDRYDRFMQGCYERYNRRSCDSSERSRMSLNLLQPGTQQNYTEIGFKHMRAPTDMMAPLMEFWESHGHEMKAETWPEGNTYVNHWDVNPSFMVSFEDRRYKEGLKVKRKIWNTIKPILEEWTGQTLVPTSLYGIRVYKEGAILAPHVDRLPLVTSCIVNVAQDLDEPWPIEVFDHDGRAHNVTMNPGDIVLYESHTVVHGRPFPLKGRYFANVFVHFQPVDEHGDPKNVGDSQEFAAGRTTPSKRKLRAQAPAAPRQRAPPAVTNEMREASGSTDLHVAAAQGDTETVLDLIKKGKDVNVADSNSWSAIHEAARGGHVEVAKHLVQAGADLGIVTTNGGTPLWWARRSLGDSHALVKYFEQIGAPELSESDEL